MNYAIMSGRLTADAEIKYTIESKPVARFTIAVNRITKKEGDPEADFFNCVCFNKTAGRIERLGLKKGTKVNVVGEIRNDNYTDKDGKTRYGTQFIVNFFEFCEKKTADSDPGSKAQESDFADIPDDLEDFPFK